MLIEMWIKILLSQKNGFCRVGNFSFRVPVNTTIQSWLSHDSQRIKCIETYLLE